MSIKNYIKKKKTLPSSFSFTINYKNINLLRRYIGITGKILPRRLTKLTAKEHRAITKAIRRARRVGLLPFVWLTNLFYMSSRTRTYNNRFWKPGFYL